MVEVITPAGHWSSYPPHKHDTDTPPVGDRSSRRPTTTASNPPQGFAFQRVYTDDRSLDETLCVEDGDVVLVPRGYHPVGAPHGYDLYYLNVMAGPQRQWIFRNDPAHEWMLKPRGDAATGISDFLRNRRNRRVGQGPRAGGSAAPPDPRSRRRAVLRLGLG